MRSRLLNFRSLMDSEYSYSHHSGNAYNAGKAVGRLDAISSQRMNRETAGTTIDSDLLVSLRLQNYSHENVVEIVSGTNVNRIYTESQRCQTAIWEYNMRANAFESYYGTDNAVSPLPTIRDQLNEGYTAGFYEQWGMQREGRPRYEFFLADERNSINSIEHRSVNPTGRLTIYSLDVP